MTSYEINEKQVQNKQKETGLCVLSCRRAAPVMLSAKKVTVQILGVKTHQGLLSNKKPPLTQQVSRLQTAAA